jgi:hypothetical protein
MTFTISFRIKDLRSYINVVLSACLKIYVFLYVFKTVTNPTHVSPGMNLAHFHATTTNTLFSNRLYRISLLYSMVISHPPHLGHEYLTGPSPGSWKVCPHVQWQVFPTTARCTGESTCTNNSKYSSLPLNCHRVPSNGRPANLSANRFSKSFKLNSSSSLNAEPSFIFFPILV